MEKTASLGTFLQQSHSSLKNSSLIFASYSFKNCNFWEFSCIFSFSRNSSPIPTKKGKPLRAFLFCTFYDRNHFLARVSTTSFTSAAKSSKLIAPRSPSAR